MVVVVVALKGHILNSLLPLSLSLCQSGRWIEDLLVLTSVCYRCDRLEVPPHVQVVERAVFHSSNKARARFRLGSAWVRAWKHHDLCSSTGLSWSAPGSTRKLAADEGSFYSCVFINQPPSQCEAVTSCHRLRLRAVTSLPEHRFRLPSCLLSHWLTMDKC